MESTLILVVWGRGRSSSFRLCISSHLIKRLAFPMCAFLLGSFPYGEGGCGFLLPRNGFLHPCWSWVVRFTFNLVRAWKLSEPTLLILLRSCGHLSGSLSIAVMPSIHLWSGGHPCHLCSPQGHRAFSRTCYLMMLYWAYFWWASGTLHA